MGSDGDPPAAAPGQQQHQNDDAADKKSKIRAFKNASSHGEGCTGAAWIQIEEGGKTVWRALTTGSDGKLVLRDGSDESLSVIKISGDHEKASPCVAVAGDGKTVASVEGCYVQVRCATLLRATTLAAGRQCVPLLILPPLAQQQRPRARSQKPPWLDGWWTKRA